MWMGLSSELTAHASLTYYIRLPKVKKQLVVATGYLELFTLCWNLDSVEKKMSAAPKAVVDSIVSKCERMNTAAHYTIPPVYGGM